MGWKDKYGNRSTTGGSLFVKLGNGDSIDFILFDDVDPVESVTKWDGEKSVPCERSDPDAQVKIMLPAYVVSRREKGSKKADPVGDMKLIRLTAKTFDTLTEAVDDDTVGGTEQIYRLKRTGEGLETRYAITRIDRATAAQLQTVSQTSVPDLARYGEPMTPPASSPEPTDTRSSETPDEDIPF